jgi:hypothetical protein
MRLSKSRFVAGLQCHRLLWWKVHEPGAVELQPDKVLQDRFDQGAQVGALARERFAGGTLIEAPYHEFETKVALTERALESGAPTIFEASFFADDTFVAADVLTRVDHQWTLIEAKSASSLKEEEHVPDAAIQAYVVGQSGIDVRAVEVMHLNKEFRFPDQGELLVRSDVTEEVREMLPSIPGEIERQLEMLSGPIPDVRIGQHCSEPRDCPFMQRCWPQSPDHIANLYNVGPKKAAEYMGRGINSIWEIPPTKKLPFAAKRQIRAMKEGRLIVEPGLAKALEPFEGKLGFLDFETIQRAVPVWPGMKPWEQAAAQFSYHEARPEGGYSHAAYLAEGPRDARPRLARALVDATAGAERVVTYSSFEKTRIRGLREAVPELSGELEALEEKLIDLLPVIRDNVYHPDFRGSFSLKYVLTPMVPELTYKDLVIIDGLVASVEIARLLFVADKIAAEERERVRQDLLDYCERDTWAMVRLLETVREFGS